MSFEASLCVYCGSSIGVDSRHLEAARELGIRLAKRRIRLVYGGARIGVMGALADAALAAGGEVVGIIPGHLDRTELGHRGATELIVVDSMHRRKYMMFELSDAFAVLPGGLGTLDEAFEILTWRKLGLHDKPIMLVDIAGYWRALLALIDHTIAQGFASPADRDLYKVVATIEELVESVAAAPRPRLAAQPERL
ncbi:MAG TPA: TIGR00730 family Rossman fold protein [Dongiaceae bacterium]|nr:TIGR00730 family Rossman fold protein [Dongiaceae bacterium]